MISPPGITVPHTTLYYRQQTQNINIKTTKIFPHKDNQCIWIPEQLDKDHPLVQMDTKL